MTHQTGIISSQDGTRLFYEQWAPAEQAPWAALVIVQGRGENTGRYAQTAEALVAEGLAVWTVDLRGQGRSQGRRGHIGSLTEFIHDVDACMAVATHASQMTPFILGHSMGGLVALHYAVEHRHQLQALVLTSPLCGLATPVARWLHWTAGQLSRWWPTFPLHRSTSDARILTHDPAVRVAFLADPLVHFRVTARLYQELERGMRRAQVLAQQLTCPTLVLQAGDDQLVAPDAIRQMYAAIGATDKQFIGYEGLYHELLNEVDAARVRHDIVHWLQQHATTTLR